MFNGLLTLKKLKVNCKFIWIAINLIQIKTNFCQNSCFFNLEETKVAIKTSVNQVFAVIFNVDDDIYHIITCGYNAPAVEEIWTQECFDPFKEWFIPW